METLDPNNSSSSSRYINLDKDLTTLDLTEFFTLEKIELNDNAQIKQLTVSLKNWILIKDIKQFKNLEFLTIQHKYDNENFTFNSLENINIIDFGVHHNLIELYINDGHQNIKKILFTNLTKLKELTLNIESYEVEIDLKDCIGLKKLDLFIEQKETVLIINQPNIEILVISGMFLYGIDLRNLINLKELYLIGVDTDQIDLISNKNLIKLITEDSVCSFKNINENVEYIDVDAYEEHGRNLIIIPKEEIEKMTKLKYLKINYFLVNNLDLNKLTELQELYYKSWNNVKNINTNIKNLYLRRLEDFDTIDENDHDKYDETYQHLNKEIEKFVNLQELSLSNLLINKLNLYNLSKLRNIQLSDLPNLKEIIIPHNYSNNFYILNCPNIINKIICRRRVYLLNETELFKNNTSNNILKEESKIIICERCHKFINIYNIINTRINNYVINSCC